MLKVEKLNANATTIKYKYNIACLGLQIKQIKHEQN